MVFNIIFLDLAYSLFGISCALLTIIGVTCFLLLIL